ADGVLDPRFAPLVAGNRDVRVRIAGGLERTRLHRLLQRFALLPLGEEWPRALAVLERGLDRRRGHRGRRRRLLRGPPPPHLRAERAHRQADHALARRSLRAGLGQRAPPAPARLLASLRDGAEAPPAMKRVLIAGGGIVLLVAAGLIAFGLYRKHQGADVHGSSTEEFVTTQAAPPPEKPQPKIRWPMYRF